MAAGLSVARRRRLISGPCSALLPHHRDTGMTLLAWFLGIVTGTVATLLLLNFRAVSERDTGEVWGV
jgi:hypothetical protein